MFKCWLSLEAVNYVSEEKNSLSPSKEINLNKTAANGYGDGSNRKTGDISVFGIHNTGGIDYDKFGWSLSFSLK